MKSCALFAKKTESTVKEKAEAAKEKAKAKAVRGGKKNAETDERTLAKGRALHTK